VKDGATRRKNTKKTLRYLFTVSLLTENIKVFYYSEINKNKKEQIYCTGFPLGDFFDQAVGELKEGRLIKEKADLEHQGPVLDISLSTEFSALVIDQIDVGSRLIDPPQEKIGDEQFLIIIPLEIGFGIKIRSKRINDPSGNDVRRKLPPLNGQIKLVAVIDKFQVKVL
jgi:hypothetical protein